MPSVSSRAKSALGGGKGQDAPECGAQASERRTTAKRAKGPSRPSWTNASKHQDANSRHDVDETAQPDIKEKGHVFIVPGSRRRGVLIRSRLVAVADTLFPTSLRIIIASLQR